MRRADIIQGVSNLNKVLTQSKLLESFKLLRNFESDNPKASFNFEELLISLNNYSIHYNHLGEVEKVIIKIMGLEGLEDPKKWAQLIYNPDKKSELSHLTRNMENTLLLLPRITDLISREFDMNNMSKNNQKDVICLILPEETGSYSSPERLSKALDSINIFYKACAEMQGLHSDDLSVVSLDSGKDKSIDFIGNAAVIKAVKDIIISIWHNALYYSDKPFAERTELIKQSLPVIGKIEDKKMKQEIGSEQAEIYKRNIAQAAEKFLSAGALIEELEKEGSRDPRNLLSPEPKLLITNIKKDESISPAKNNESQELNTHQKPTEKVSSSAATLNTQSGSAKLLDKLDNLSDEDQELFMELFEKMKISKNQEEEDKISTPSNIDFELELDNTFADTTPKKIEPEEKNLLDPKDSIGNLWNFKMNHKLNDVD
ncbi:MAG: hypothetical protein NW226_00185 [Microscillaceae bacterium]|nr:hypothetical protein [Microscillaceae bacterium]